MHTHVLTHMHIPTHTSQIAIANSCKSCVEFSEQLKVSISPHTLTDTLLFIAGVHIDVYIHILCTICMLYVLHLCVWCKVVSSSLLDRILVNFYHCFSGVAQVCRDAAGI